MDYNYLAESLAALAGVPVRIYRDGRFLSLHHTRFKPDFAITEEENIFKIAGDVGYYMDPNFLYYGLFRIRGEDIALVIGPVSPSPVSRNLARKILARMGEPGEPHPGGAGLLFGYARLPPAELFADPMHHPIFH